jgi:hypothetical protein
MEKFTKEEVRNWLQENGFADYIDKLKDCTGTILLFASKKSLQKTTGSEIVGDALYNKLHPQGSSAN